MGLRQKLGTEPADILSTPVPLLLYIWRGNSLKRVASGECKLYRHIFTVSFYTMCIDVKIIDILGHNIDDQIQKVHSGTGTRKVAFHVDA